MRCFFFFLFNSKGNLLEKLQLCKLEAQIVLKNTGKMLSMYYLSVRQKRTIQFHEVYKTVTRPM